MKRTEHLAKLISKAQRKQAKRNRVVVAGHGITCPRCKRPTQIREHAAITAKELRQPYYYARWYRCTHRDCKTTLIMPEEFKIYNDVPQSTEVLWTDDEEVSAPWV